MFAVSLCSLIFSGLVCAAAPDDLRDPEPLDTPLEHVLKLEGKQYYNKKPDNELHFGLIPSAVHDVYPEVVSSENDVQYVELIAPIIESIKTIYHRVVDTDERVKKLEALLIQAHKDSDLYRQETEIRLKALEQAH